jgi:hypothetical protein
VVEFSSVIVTGLMEISYTIIIPVMNVIKEISLKLESDSILITLQIYISIVIITLNLFMEEYQSGKIFSDIDPMDLFIRSIISTIKIEWNIA